VFHGTILPGCRSAGRQVRPVPAHIVRNLTCCATRRMRWLVCCGTPPAAQPRLLRNPAYCGTPPAAQPRLLRPPGDAMSAAHRAREGCHFA